MTTKHKDQMSSAIYGVQLLRSGAQAASQFFETVCAKYMVFEVMLSAGVQ